MFLEVDVKPFATCRLGVQNSVADERGGNPLPLILTPDLGIEEEDVIASVPRHVDKADEATATQQTSGHPAKAVGPDLIPPPGCSPSGVCSDKSHHLCIRDRSTPAVLNRLGHATFLPGETTSHVMGGPVEDSTVSHGYPPDITQVSVGIGGAPL